MPIDIPKKVREFAGMAEALAGLVEIADKHNALVQFEAEHAARVAKMRDEEAAIRERVTAAELREADAHAKALEIIEQAKVDGDAIRAKAASEADQIRDAANQAVEIAKAKERRAESDQRKAEAACATNVARLAELESKLAEAREIIADADRIVAARKKP